MQEKNNHRYPEFKSLDLTNISKEILDFWEKESIFEKSVTSREGSQPFVFFEGPPSANGMPGIHHVMARTIKDLFCRFQTLNGKQVKRKAGWDTHGLPIELAVEKSLGITKVDIGNKITIEEYNSACRKEVLKFQDKWEELTRLMGYWVDMKDPYITYENDYIESVWWLLKTLYDKKLLYKGYTIQPYSPAAGTGLSTHELNQPGCYRNVKDTSVVAQFKIIKSSTSEHLFTNVDSDLFFLAWTTTPWTLPANCALAVGPKIEYSLVASFNPYSHEKVFVILASELVSKYFPEKNSGISFEEYQNTGKDIPFKIIREFKGSELIGIKYEQLLPYVKPTGKALEVIAGDFVTTEDGTGVVHTASVFGADDFRVCKENEISSILVKDDQGNELPLVDKRGRFVQEVNDEDWGLAGEYVKQEYLSETEKKDEHQKQRERLKKYIPDLKSYLSVDERIALKLKLEGKAFKIEKYEHNYPHCWRTDKPILYYPLDSWFVKVTDHKDRLVKLNNTINWKPSHTGTGRFGEWLNNLQDWNLSRSRFWGIPLPVWRTEDGKEEKCIGSIEELEIEIRKAEQAGFRSEFPLGKEKLDLHKPYIDRVTLVSDSGMEMKRESDLIDVWFDSGSMPYAQWHYPFENKDMIDKGKAFPADFIAEGVDQTRGWFYTLHAIAALCFDQVAYKNVVSNGLVLDKDGNKMSKRLGNAVDPFSTLEKFGPDAVRWYMVTNAAPWDNLKFDLAGVKEKQTGFFSTLYNTYSFFSLYANIDGFNANKVKAVDIEKRSELDRWILSNLHSLIEKVTANYENYDPTPAGRAIEDFVDEHLSNWYVRLSRRKFWKGTKSEEKTAAYATLHECLITVAQLMSPIAPFFSDWLYINLSGSDQPESVHLSYLKKANSKVINKELEERMELAQQISSMVLSIRKKENIRVRQPLSKIRIPILNEDFKRRLKEVEALILSEVNVKQIEFISDTDQQIVKNIKLNFKTLGKKCGKDMKEVKRLAEAQKDEIIKAIEGQKAFNIVASGTPYSIDPEDVDIIPVDIPGWKVVNQGPITVALDLTITEQLKEEGLAREIVNRLQNLRKENKFEVTDKISVQVQNHPKINTAILNNLDYIRAEILADKFDLVDEISEKFTEIEVEAGLLTKVYIHKN